MNYKSQLKAWAIDQVSKLSKESELAVGSIEDAIVHAEKLLAYAYIPREDLESTAKDLFELVRNAPPGESSVDALIGTLEHIKADRLQQGIDKLTEETTGETVQ